MSPVGSYLRELRQRRGVSLEEIARVTRVAHRYLEALESDDFTFLPAPVFTRGFIRAYCQALGVGPDEALGQYAESLGGGREGGPAHAVNDAVPAAQAVEAARRGRGAVLVSFVLLVVLGVALFATTLVLQAGREGHQPKRVSALSTSPAPPEPTPSEEVVPPPPSPAPPSADAVPKPAAAPSTGPPTLAMITDGVRSAIGGITSPYRLVARTSEPTWLRVRTEDGRVSEETIPAGQIREWVSNHPFVLTVGNAGGVALELNGRALPRLGASGAVINGLVVPPPGS